MGTSPPSAQAGDETEKTGRGGPPFPPPPLGGCAIMSAPQDNTASAVSEYSCVLFIGITLKANRFFRSSCCSVYERTGSHAKSSPLSAPTSGVRRRNRLYSAGGCPASSRTRGKG